jgi:Ca2+-binding RTX toxin-like protein
MRSLPISSRRLLVPTCAAALLAAVPGAAQASTITSDGGGHYTFTGAPGEKNHLSVQGRDDSADVVFYSGGSGVIVTSFPAACAGDDPVAPEVVTCPSVTGVAVNAGDGDDDITSSVHANVPLTVDGGPGSDWITGDLGDDTFSGGPGNDKLDGRKGNDVLDGGDGDDELIGYSGADRLLGGNGNDNLSPDGHEEPGADVVDGGPGYDTIDSDYSSRFAVSGAPNPLSFTLAGGADDGRAGENDDIQGIERLIVSSNGRFVGSDGPEYIKMHQVGGDGEIIGNGGDDELLGGDGADKLDGGAGNDKLDGGYGDDTIVGGPGKDIISGDRAVGDCGPIWCKFPYGNDTIDVRDGEVDSVSCGAGTDTVLADAADVVAPDCENVTRSGAPASPGPAPAPGKPGAPGTKDGGTSGTAKVALAGRVTLATALRKGITVKVTGVKAGTVKLTATRGRTTVARGSGKATKAGAASVRLRFTAKARRSLRHAKSITLKISGSGVAGTITVRRR